MVHGVGRTRKVNSGIRILAAACMGLLAAAPVVRGQTVTCGSAGPDAALDIFDVANFNPVGGYDALAVGAYVCNVGSVAIPYSACPNNHPVFGANLYRYSVLDGAGRFEQVGQAWLKHTAVAAQGSRCCTCMAVTGGGFLGPGCGDLYTAGFQTSQGFLGPRSQINAYTGFFPAACPPHPAGGNFGRLEVALADLAVAPGGPAAATRYFVETQVIARDDALYTDAAHPVPVNGLNNASNIEAAVTGAPANYSFALYPAGGAATNTQRGVPAIRRWKEIDPRVTETVVDVPGEGRYWLSSKATSLGGSPAMWRYEYALFNLNSDRCAGSFSVPLPPGATGTSTGFHAVIYRGGDGVGNVNVDPAPWAVSTVNSAVAWATEDFAANPNANALRWSTLTNFRFDSPAPPMAGGGMVTIGLWKPGTPATVAAAAQAPGCSSPVFTTQPVSASVCATGSAPFAASATGVAPVTYQWQAETGPGEWVNIGPNPLPLGCGGSGGNSASVIATGGASAIIRIRPCFGVAAYRVRCVVTDASGCPGSVSAPANYIICKADFNCSGPVAGIGTPSVSVQDVFDFLAAYFGNDSSADFNNADGVGVQDVFDYLGAYFSSCG